METAYPSLYPNLTESSRRSTHACISACVPWPDSQTYQHDLGEIGLVIEQKHQSLGLWITESNIVLEDFWSFGSEHESGKEHPNEWESCESA